MFCERPPAAGRPPGAHLLKGCSSCGSVTTPLPPRTLSKNARSASCTAANRGSRCSGAPLAALSCRKADSSREGLRWLQPHMLEWERPIAGCRGCSAAVAFCHTCAASEAPPIGARRDDGHAFQLLFTRSTDECTGQSQFTAVSCIYTLLEFTNGSHFQWEPATQRARRRPRVPSAPPQLGGYCARTHAGFRYCLNSTVKQFAQVPHPSRGRSGRHSREKAAAAPGGHRGNVKTPPPVSAFPFFGSPRTATLQTASMEGGGSWSSSVGRFPFAASDALMLDGEQQHQQQHYGQQELTELASRALRVLLGATSVILHPQLRLLVLGGGDTESSSRRWGWAAEWGRSVPHALAFQTLGGCRLGRADQVAHAADAPRTC